MNPEEITQSGQFKRATAYKLKIGDILNGKIISDEGRFNFLELGDKQVIRVNILANIIEKFLRDDTTNPTNPNEPESTANTTSKKYLSFTIDDASGQLRIKIFGDDIEKFRDLSEGDTILVIGKLREYNNELYILPEIIRKQEPRYLLVRKLELEKQAELQQNSKPKPEQSKSVRDQILEMIKESEKDEGIDTEKIILNIKASPELINQEIKKLLEEGIIYEPRPGIVRYLG